MKKAAILSALLILAVLTGAVAFAANAYNVNERFGLYAEAAGEADTSGIERIYLAEITYNNLQLPDSSVVQNIQVYVDKEKLCEGLTDANRAVRLLSVSTVFALIKSRLEQNGYTVTSAEDYLEISLGDYESLTDLYVASGATGYDRDDGSGNKTVWGVWYNKYFSTSKTVFSRIGEDSMIALIADELQGISGISGADIAYIYNYGTKYTDKTISSDADKIYYYQQAGVYIHKFVMDETTLDRSATFSQNTPNVLTWYLLAIAATAIPAAIFIAYANHKKKEGID